MPLDAIIRLVEKHDCLLRPAKTLAHATRALVNTWNLYTPIKDHVPPFAVSGAHTFTDRKHDADTLVIILAGYKSELWQAVFPRIIRDLPAGVDVCVASSGKNVEYLQNLCAERGWSYLSTTRNHVSLVQNIAIHLHPKAVWIYKIDEDMFLTRGFFAKLKALYARLEAETPLRVGFAAPLIPLNGYGHVRILERLGLQQKWEARFGKLVYDTGIHGTANITKNPDCAKFLWGETCPELRDIDALNARLEKDGDHSLCPIRFSIGAILFRRETWLDWGTFPVVVGTGMGEDESHLCSYCMEHGRIIAVAENAAVGHFAYGPQNHAMLAFGKKVGLID